MAGLVECEQPAPVGLSSKGGDQRQEKEDQQNEHEARTFVGLGIGQRSRAGLLDRHCSASLMMARWLRTGVHNRSSVEELGTRSRGESALKYDEVASLAERPFGSTSSRAGARRRAQLNPSVLVAVAACAVSVGLVETIFSSVVAESENAHV